MQGVRIGDGREGGTDALARPTDSLLPHSLPSPFPLLPLSSLCVFCSLFGCSCGCPLLQQRAPVIAQYWVCHHARSSLVRFCLLWVCGVRNMTVPPTHPRFFSPLVPLHQIARLEAAAKAEKAEQAKAVAGEGERCHVPHESSLDLASALLTYRVW